MRILLIENDPVVAQSITLMLSAGPFAVETTAFGDASKPSPAPGECRFSLSRSDRAEGS
jgi:hypothetical protein